MENPATWGEAERIVHDTLYRHAEHQIAVRTGAEKPVIGLSLARQITDALRTAGLLEGRWDDREAVGERLAELGVDWRG